MPVELPDGPVGVARAWRVWIIPTLCAGTVSGRCRCRCVGAARLVGSRTQVVAPSSGSWCRGGCRSGGRSVRD
jgi:hypothetical protein